MIQQNAPISGGRRALSLILAVVFGILTPVAMTLEVMLILPVVMLSGLFMVFFHAYGGRMSAWLYMTVQLAATAVLLGSTFMWMTMVAGTFPGILCMRGILGKQSFFGQLRVDIAFYLFGLLGAVLIAFGAYGGNIIGRGMDYFEAQFKQIPDSWFQPFVEAINAQLQLSGSARLSVEGYRAQAQAVIQLMGETFARELQDREKQKAEG